LDVHVLVPLKRLARAKSRLGKALPPADRAELMLSLLDGVIATVRGAGVDRITLVTPEEVTIEGVGRWADPGLPWNDALAEAARAVVREHVVTIVSADLPLVAPPDVRALIEATPTRGVAVGRAHDGGTNAVSMRPLGAMDTLFGRPSSARLHADAARARGLECRILDRPGLACDVDTPEDLERMFAARKSAEKNAA
jgi:2-phospho-L-lactate/phosphoenolpyruvate guanylyltransferase